MRTDDVRNPEGHPHENSESDWDSDVGDEDEIFDSEDT